MKSNYLKSVIVFFLFSISSLILSSCDSNSCDLSGCEREGQGWFTSSQKPECANWGVCRPQSYGGYCSKSHAQQDQ